jgi:hypothetical protein
LAVRRAILGAAIEVMANVDDSGGGWRSTSAMNRLTWRTCRLPRSSSILQDLLELVTWGPDIHHVGSFSNGCPVCGRLGGPSQRDSSPNYAPPAWPDVKAQRLRLLVLASADDVGTLGDRRDGRLLQTRTDAQ